MLMLYTDGVIEARRGRELFGEERLAEVVGQCAGLPASDTVDAIVAAVAAHADELEDDMAVVALRRSS